jgi:hypothetical protein
MHDRPPRFPYGDGDEDEEPARQASFHRLPHAHQPQDPDEGESPRYRSGKGDLVWPCPSCESFRTEQRHIARRICSAIGAAAGATSAITASLSGAETGAAIGMLGGPVGAVCGSVAGAILAGLVAGVAGCATGAALGEALDLKCLDNWRCLACGRSFAVRPG